MTKIQERTQCDGPHRPTAEKFALMILRQIPSHLEIRAVSIRGQSGGIVVECLHDGMEINFELEFV